MPTTDKERRWGLLRRTIGDLSTAIHALTTVIPRVIQLERDLAIAMATELRLIGENASLRQMNRELRKMVVDLQMEKVASDARRK